MLDAVSPVGYSQHFRLGAGNSSALLAAQTAPGSATMSGRGISEK